MKKGTQKKRVKTYLKLKKNNNGTTTAAMYYLGPLNPSTRFG